MIRNGFSLIEVLVVIALIGIMLSIGTLQFNNFLAKGAVERQTRELYSDFMVTRTAAMTQHAPKSVIMTPTGFTFYSSSLGTGGTFTRSLSKAVTWAGKTPSETEKRIDFDQRGILDSAGITICVEPSVENAQVDSIVLFTTRIHLGKIDFGSECNSANFKVK